MIRLTRKELYNDIWTDTLSKTVLKYQLSTVQLKKICNSLNVPTPSGFVNKDREKSKLFL